MAVIGVVAFVLVVVGTLAFLRHLRPRAWAVLVGAAMIVVADLLLWQYLVDDRELFESYTDETTSDEVLGNVAVLLPAIVVALLIWPLVAWVASRRAGR